GGGGAATGGGSGAGGGGGSGAAGGGSGTGGGGAATGGGSGAGGGGAATGGGSGAGGGGASGPPTTLIFSDEFERTSGSDLGAGWSISTGLWLTTSGRAQSDLTGNDLVVVAGKTCSDCRVDANVVGFGVPQTGV